MAKSHEPVTIAEVRQMRRQLDDLFLRMESTVEKGVKGDQIQEMLGQLVGKRQMFKAVKAAKPVKRVIKKKKKGAAAKTVKRHAGGRPKRLKGEELRNAVEKVLPPATEHKGLKLSQVCEVLHQPPESVRYALNTLRTDNRVRMRGLRATAQWFRAGAGTTN